MSVELPAVIALGSNLGDREATLRAAVRAVDALAGVTVTAASGIVESAALTLAGVDESAPSYLNAVIVVRSRVQPEDLLEALQGIETSLGRERTVRWGDRTLDLDLIDAVVRRDSESLTLPHPRAWERAFVLAPWLEVQPDAVVAGRGTVRDLLAAASDSVTAYPAPPLLERCGP
jgi:2-amino-4-hydroxy-6-hydroxymethyldihydropteridine diphosphokinase